MRQSDFFDFDRAKRYWATVQTDEQWDAIDVPCDKGPYSRWKQVYERNPAQALESLKGNPQAEEIKACHDFSLTYRRWGQIYHSWLATFPPRPWNMNTTEHDCGVIPLLNIFTGQCNDLPDWRTVDDRARDAKRLADYEAVQPGKGK